MRQLPYRTMIQKGVQKDRCASLTSRSRFVTLKRVLPVVLALSLALYLALLFPGLASAHAILLRSDPAKDAVLALPPHEVRMWFSEDLNPAFTTAVIVNGARQRVDT